MKRHLQKLITALILLLPAAGYSSTLSDEQRIRELEYQVSILNKKVEQLSAIIEQRPDHPLAGRHLYQCTLNIFGQRYKSRSEHRGKAIAHIVDQCSQDHDEMFCRPDTVECKKY